MGRRGLIKTLDTLLGDHLISAAATSDISLIPAVVSSSTATNSVIVDSC